MNVPLLKVFLLLLDQTRVKFDLICCAIFEDGTTQTCTRHGIVAMFSNERVLLVVRTN